MNSLLLHAVLSMSFNHRDNFNDLETIFTSIYLHPRCHLCIQTILHNEGSYNKAYLFQLSTLFQLGAPAV